MIRFGSPKLSRMNALTVPAGCDDQKPKSKCTLSNASPPAMAAASVVRLANEASGAATPAPCRRNSAFELSLERRSAMDGSACTCTSRSFANAIAHPRRPRVVAVMHTAERHEEPSSVRKSACVSHALYHRRARSASASRVCASSHLFLVVFLVVPAGCALDARGRRAPLSKDGASGGCGGGGGGGVGVGMADWRSVRRVRITIGCDGRRGYAQRDCELGLAREQRERDGVARGGRERADDDGRGVGRLAQLHARAEGLGERLDEHGVDADGLHHGHHACTDGGVALECPRHRQFRLRREETNMGLGKGP
eukprot:5086517-Pleurochrysis_carterae.AAC.1